jgi:hypothetical protein
MEILSGVTLFMVKMHIITSAALATFCNAVGHIVKLCMVALFRVTVYLKTH